MTCSARVGLTLPDLLALGAAIGHPDTLISLSAVFFEGILMAMVSSPAPAISETIQVRAFGKTNVRAPGQKTPANASVCRSKTAISLASLIFET